jgi:hypothetical protein
METNEEWCQEKEHYIPTTTCREADNRIAGIPEEAL